MEWLRRQGYTVAKVEHRLPIRRVTVDLFGFIDVLAIKEGEPGVLGVQATTIGHLRDRERKVRGEPRHAIWLAAGNRIQVIGWALRDIGKRTVWTPTVLDIRHGESYPLKSHVVGIGGGNAADAERL